MASTEEMIKQIGTDIANAVATATPDVMTHTDMLQWGAIGALFIVSIICLLQPKLRLRDVVKDLNDHQLKR